MKPSHMIIICLLCANLLCTVLTLQANTLTERRTKLTAAKMTELNIKLNRMEKTHD